MAFSLMKHLLFERGSYGAALIIHGRNKMKNVILFLSSCFVAWFTISAIGAFFWIVEIPLEGLLFTCLFGLLARLAYVQVAGRMQRLPEATQMNIWFGAMVVTLVGGALIGHWLNLPTIAIDPPLSTTQTFSDNDRDLVVTFMKTELLVGILLSTIAFIRTHRSGRPTPPKKRKSNVIHVIVPSDPRNN